MKRLVVSYVAMGVVCFVAMAGWLNADLSSFSSSRVDRHAAGGAVIIAALWSVGWPIFTPVTYCMTGFAEDGWLFPGQERKPVRNEAQF